MPGMHPLFYWIYLIALLAFVALVVALLHRMSAAREKREHEEKQRKIDARIERGELLANGTAPCVVCQSAEAKFALPVIGLSWFERMNPLRSLYGSVKLYRREDAGKFAEVNACGACATLYSAIIDQELADMRRAAAEFAAAMDRRVSNILAGNAVLEARMERAGAIRAIQNNFQRRVPMLAAVNHEELAVGAQTTNGKAVDDKPEMTN